MLEVVPHGYPRGMTDPRNPEAPHSPGTPSLDDLETPEPQIPPEDRDSGTGEEAGEPPD